MCSQRLLPARSDEYPEPAPGAYAKAPKLGLRTQYHLALIVQAFPGAD